MWNNWCGSYANRKVNVSCETLIKVLESIDIVKNVSCETLVKCWIVFISVFEKNLKMILEKCKKPVSRETEDKRWNESVSCETFKIKVIHLFTKLIHNFFMILIIKEISFLAVLK